MRERAGEPKADIEMIVDHVEHITCLAGEDHVGFGSDFDGIPQAPRDAPDCAAFPRILDRLAARGFSHRSLRKIAWENFLRVLRATD
jgi:membrane dipeptidase